MEEYLRTSYEWEPEWVDGELVERSLPNNAHSKTQDDIAFAFRKAKNVSRLFCRPQLRIRVSPSRWRIPDLAVFADREPEGDYPSNVFCAVEILSPGDSLAEALEKFSEYAALKIPHIYLADPIHNLLFRYEGRSLKAVDAIEFPERSFRLTAPEIFA